MKNKQNQKGASLHKTKMNEFSGIKVIPHVAYTILSIWGTEHQMYGLSHPPEPDDWPTGNTNHTGCLLYRSDFNWWFDGRLFCTCVLDKHPSISVIRELFCYLTYVTTVNSAHFHVSLVPRIPPAAVYSAIAWRPPPRHRHICAFTIISKKK